MRFVSRSECRSRFEGKTVAIVGSGPGCAKNPDGLVDSHDVVVRVNNYRLMGGTGKRCDVHYSFYGSSIKKPADDLKRDGVTLCMCKCPNAHAIESEWHVRNKKQIGVDYRPHYRRREGWWFTDTYIPTIDQFMMAFRVLDFHMPTTGFAAIYDVISFNPKSLFLTGFDFFRSRIHNVNEPWRAKNLDDPIRHEPERELSWLKANMQSHPITVDAALSKLLSMKEAA